MCWMTFSQKIRKIWETPALIWPALQEIIWPVNWVKLQLLARLNGTNLVTLGSFRKVGKLRIQGRGKIIVGKGVGFGYALSADFDSSILLQARTPQAEIIVGMKTQIMNGCQFVAVDRIKIGDDCMIGPACLIMDSDFHQIDPTKRGENGNTSPIVIEENVWVGARVTILKGVHIGRDAVVAAGAVVVRDVPAGAIVGGNPAKNLGSVYA